MMPTSEGPPFGMGYTMTTAPRAGRWVSLQKTVPEMEDVAGGGAGGLDCGVGCVVCAVSGESSVVWARMDVEQQTRNTAVKSCGRMVRISVLARCSARTNAGWLPEGTHETQNGVVGFCEVCE